METGAFLVGMKIGVIFVVAALAIFGVIIIVYNLAKLNIIFTFVQEGQIKSIEKFGKFHRMVIAYEGYSFDQEWIIRPLGENGQRGKRWVKDEKGNIKEEEYTIELWHQPPKWLGGLRLVGIPLIHTVHWYNFRWASFEQIEEDGKLTEKIKYTEKKIDYILAKDDVYYTFLKEAETAGMVPVNLGLLLTIRIVNPYLALYRVQDWLETVLNQVKPAFRRFVAGLQFEEIIQKEEKMEREYDVFLQNSMIAEYSERNYGARLKKVGIVTIDPAGKRALDYVAAATKKYEALRQSEQITTLAQADIERMDKIYDKIKSFGDEGLFIRMTEAIEQAGKGPSNLVIFPFGSIQSMFEGWLGKKRKE